jgi:alkanesulfonate monooxygenase
MIQLFSTCPRSNKVARARFLDCVADVARWSERAGCGGIVIPADSTLVDPWMLAQVIVRASTTLCPVVSVLPAYTDAFWTAKQVSSFAYLYGRRVGINVVVRPGCDAADVARLTAFTASLQRFTGGDRSAASDGTDGDASPVKLAPLLPKGLSPAVFVPGSTVSVGVIARESSNHAWAIARSRFPCERRRTEEDSPYWLTPLRDYGAGCPYLVGSYDVVAAELERYLSAGSRAFVVDVPVDPEELDHVQIAFARAQTSVGAPMHAEAAAR